MYENVTQITPDNMSHSYNVQPAGLVRCVKSDKATEGSVAARVGGLIAELPGDEVSDPAEICRVKNVKSFVIKSVRWRFSSRTNHMQVISRYGLEMDSSTKFNTVIVQSL